MYRIYRALLFVSQRLINTGLNTVINKIHKKTTIPLINQKTIEYMKKGYNENEAIIEALYDLDYISNKDIQALRKNFNYQKGKKSHCFNNGGKSYDYDNIRCEDGTKEHCFSEYNGKCINCGIIGCAIGLQEHVFSDSNGKCIDCGILGCATGLRKHCFDDDNGKCFDCGIIGCKYGIIEHFFDDDNGKCWNCGAYKK